ncbi:MAG: histone deacetylase [Gammaproteobacteria bacterium]|nr:histone deacetylase [Gammaproteobacteria bacterium]
MKLYRTDQFVLPLPADHRFPISKYSRLRERVVVAKLVAPHELLVAPAVTDEELLRAHTIRYIDAVTLGRLSPREIRALGFPWSAQLVERSRRSSGATLEACRVALNEGYAVNLAGGTHHAYADRGEGYCVFNDAAVAALAMIAEGRARRVMIIDCDVHQGNGTAAIMADEPSVFTFSIHGERNYPSRKECSDLDIALPDDTGDEEYLSALDRGLKSSQQRFSPDLAIYLAGADPFWDDRLGRLALTKSGLLNRDRLVLEHCARLGAPVAVAMAGGYARDRTDTVDIHFNTVSAVVEHARADS